MNHIRMTGLGFRRFEDRAGVEPCMWRMEDAGLDHLVVMGGPAIGSVIILGSAPDWLHEEERFAFGAILADLSYC
ncbi:hypothetical protein MUK42_03222 [Musa troglodytarum]|uniref:Uncharacterized protein n=1 Tax=Musa troglodytarum TaxID=320322 RepID=A0A9E7JGD6_9LILI|nr:hypothetical protein MUK42_03222 [Musa troglodytarum]